MRIITISREFGSGGRELGRSLADLLGCDYYDKEIIAAIADSRQLDQDYVARRLENHGWKSVPLSRRSSFSAVAPSIQTELLLAQRRVIAGIAAQGRDCVIVGRNADLLLCDCEPFNLFVCADMEAKTNRCMRFAEQGEQLSRKELQRKMKEIDKNRAQTRELLTNSKWGDRTAYHLCVNTSDWSIEDLAPAVKEFADRWFRRKS